MPCSAPALHWHLGIHLVSRQLSQKPGFLDPEVTIQQVVVHTNDIFRVMTAPFLLHTLQFPLPVSKLTGLPVSEACHHELVLERKPPFSRLQSDLVVRWNIYVRM